MARRLMRISRTRSSLSMLLLRSRLRTPKESMTSRPTSSVVATVVRAAPSVWELRELFSRLMARTVLLFVLLDISRLIAVSSSVRSTASRRLVSPVSSLSVNPLTESVNRDQDKRIPELFRTRGFFLAVFLYNNKYTMRLDKYLKVSRLIKRREAAKEFIDKGYVRLNGKVAKPSTEVKPGDRIEISTPLGKSITA